MPDLPPSTPLLRFSVLAKDAQLLRLDSAASWALQARSRVPARCPVCGVGPQRCPRAAGPLLTLELPSAAADSRLAEPPGQAE